MRLTFHPTLTTYPLQHQVKYVHCPHIRSIVQRLRLSLYSVVYEYGTLSPGLSKEIFMHCSRTHCLHTTATPQTHVPITTQSPAQPTFF